MQSEERFLEVKGQKRSLNPEKGEKDAKPAGDSTRRIT
jgi:hypothetical protein